MEHLEETKYLIHTATGALNYLGGDFTEKKINEMQFGDVIDYLIRNGAKITIQIQREREFKID